MRMLSSLPTKGLTPWPPKRLTPWRLLLIFCIGCVFSAIGLFVFAVPVVADLRTGRAAIGIRSSNRLWLHVYTFRDHPVYFTLKVLRDASGTLALVGMGSLLLYVAVRLIFDPSGARVSTRARRIGNVWALACIGGFILFLALRALLVVLALHTGAL